jgi:hypothetical protein
MPRSNERAIEGACSDGVLRYHHYWLLRVYASLRPALLLYLVLGLWRWRVISAMIRWPCSWHIVVCSIVALSVIGLAACCSQERLTIRMGAVFHFGEAYTTGRRELVSCVSVTV